ncbi:hypothetical protein K491DRAFT_420884 [Lophiostoma macrostomum CBS 122681]|uniref:Uncharacterized protein n=1 Tax=Lophiostoma macrostomum CBS 122681 TaxID=1314788 RepID=A0A6A6TRW6_9PLEO|nr:hypothetical protein K491DRAFT_420884 [Lophiostoma macrostomum CBS 122681]
MMTSIPLSPLFSRIVSDLYTFNVVGNRTIRVTLITQREERNCDILPKSAILATLHTFFWDIPTFNSTKARPSGLCITSPPTPSAGFSRVQDMWTSRVTPHPTLRLDGRMATLKVPMLHATVSHLVLHYLAPLHDIEAHVVQAPSQLDSLQAVAQCEEGVQPHYY